MSFLKDAELQIAENLLRSYGKFLRNYKENLKQRVTSSKTDKDLRLFQLKFEDVEKTQVFELLDSDNKILNKILLVFFHLGREARRLNNGSKRIIEKLIIIEDEIKSSENDELTPEEASNNAVVKFSYALEDLLNMKFLIQNSIFLIYNVIHQFSALFTMEKYLSITMDSPCFPSNLDDVANLLKNLMILDEIFENSDYKTYLKLYGELIAAQEGQVDDNVLRNLQNTIQELFLLLDGNIFQLAIDNLLALKGKLRQKTLKKLENFLLTYIKNLIYSVNIYDSNICELTETDEIIKLNIFVVLYQKLFGNLDPKNLRLATEINTKFCAITIYNILWNGNEFLRRNVPSLEKINFDVARVQQTFMNQKVQSLGKDAVLLYTSQVSSSKH